MFPKPHSKISSPWSPLIWLVLACCLLLAACSPQSKTPIPVGVAFSLSGAMAVSERPLVDSVQMAIDETNAAGGVLGRPLEAVILDNRSDPGVAAENARRLIEQHRVAVIFGCWTSSCRKAVKPVVEQQQIMLVYPLQYEGLERSAHILYTGAAPNQQIIPGIRWAMKNLGKRFYLVGSAEDLFPHAANLLIRDLSGIQGCTVVGERYLPLERGAQTDRRIADTVAEIAALAPSVVVNSITGERNGEFFRALRAHPDTARLPVLSLRVAEAELAAIGEAGITEHYTVWSYFQSISSAHNTRFVEDFRRRYGKQRVIGDPMEAAYVGVKLWATAVREALSLDLDAIRQALGNLSLNAPQGVVSVDRDNRHLWRSARVAKATADGQFQVVWRTEHPIRPNPFPAYRDPAHWRLMLSPLLMPEGGE